MSFQSLLRLRLAAFALSALLFGACQSMPADLATADAAAKKGDYATAVQNWQILSEYGYAEAHMKLGQAYLKGTGVEADPAKALPLFESAAAKGKIAANVELGQMYEKGLGVKKDPAKAEAYYLTAAAQKYPRGMMALGRFYERHKQKEKALFYYKGAQDLGLEAASEKVNKLQGR